jgi:hypothetical protein
MKKKNKKDSKVIQVLNEDCRTCVRQQIAESPFMQDLYNAKAYTMISLKGSIPYLKEMTNIIKEHLLSTATSDRGKAIFSDYSTDIMTLLDLFTNMRKNV